MTSNIPFWDKTHLLPRWSLGVLMSNIRASASGSTSAPLFAWLQVAPGMASLKDLKVRIKCIRFNIFKLKNNGTPNISKQDQNMSNMHKHIYIYICTNIYIYIYMYIYIYTERMHQRDADYRAVGWPWLHPSGWKHAAKIRGAWRDSALNMVAPQGNRRTCQV